MNPNSIDAPEFTDEQLRDALKRVGSAAREAAFSAGRPILIVREGQLVEQHADGTERLLGPVKAPSASVSHQP